MNQKKWFAATVVQKCIDHGFIVVILACQKRLEVDLDNVQSSQHGRYPKVRVKGVVYYQVSGGKAVNFTEVFKKTK